MAFRFLHTADLHLGSPLTGLKARAPELAGLFDRASRRAFDSLVDLAIDEQVAFVVIAGDVFDQDWTDYATGQVFVRGLARLARAGIRAVIIRGNHDAEHVMTRSLPLPDGMAWLGADAAGTVDLPEFGVVVHGMSFKTRVVTENMIPRYPVASPGRFNIGLLHTSLDGRPDHSGYAPCAIADLARFGYDYWGLGHIHTREVVNQHPFVVYPGNIQGRHVREAGERSVALVTVTDGRVAAVEHRPVDAARWALVEVDASGAETVEDIHARARLRLEDAATAAAGRPLAARIRLVGETRLHDRLLADRDRLAAELQAVAAAVSDAIAVERVKTETRPRRVAGPALALDDLDEAFAAALADPALAEEIAADLATLKAKLPPLAAGRLEPDADAVLAAARALIRSRLEA
ncbi:metallophosphoesterase family protein [Chthonobacter rhizosphaerae]|uniref:metallophosphoesterase family protein n=1 Tax=Chthonobacter rhizosphaerae TaxID=2735553 RepID=UPI0015EEF0D9|nr:DNA repair exonuclease [Chthonobacter rhizosphaerae]